MTVPYYACALIVFALHIPMCRAQQEAPPPEQRDACSDLKNRGTLPDNVQSIATTLKICSELQQVLQVGRNRTPSPGVLQKQGIAPEGQEQKTSPDESKSVQERVADLEARQHISEAINRALLNSNLVSLQLRDVLIESQIASFNAEQRAYRRTKILNAFLGTTVGAVGSGLQLSKDMSVQRAGDYVSVAGGVITAAFALCTAGIDEKDNPPDNAFSKALTNDNQEHNVPVDVWSYLREKKALEDLAVATAPSPPSKKWLSCHLKGAPRETGFVSRQIALKKVNKALLQMNIDLADLSKAVSQ